VVRYLGDKAREEAIERICMMVIRDFPARQVGELTLYITA